MATFKDRVKDTTSSTGTGALTLDGLPPTAYQGFSVLAFTAFYYCVSSEDTGEWEVGYGTVSADGLTLTRNSGDYAVLASSAGGTTAVNFSAGEKEVICCAPSMFFTQQQPQIKVDSSNPVDAPASWNNTKYQGFEVGALGFAVEFITTGQFKLRAYRVSSFDGSGNAQWGEVPIAGWKFDTTTYSPDVISPAYTASMAVDLTGLNKPTDENLVLAGTKAYGWQKKSLSVGFDVYGTETGFGFHQSDIVGDGAYTTNATLAEMNFGLQADGAGLYTIHVVAYSDAGDYKAWKADAVVTRGAAGTGSVKAVGTLTEVAASAGAASWTATLVDGATAGTTSTYNGLLVQVTGAAATNIHWTASAFATYAHNSSFT